MLYRTLALLLVGSIPLVHASGAPDDLVSDLAHLTDQLKLTLPEQATLLEQSLEEQENTRVAQAEEFERLKKTKQQEEAAQRKALREYEERRRAEIEEQGRLLERAKKQTAEKRTKAAITEQEHVLRTLGAKSSDPVGLVSIVENQRKELDRIEASKIIESREQAPGLNELTAIIPYTGDNSGPSFSADDDKSQTFRHGPSLRSNVAHTRPSAPPKPKHERLVDRPPSAPRDHSGALSRGVPQTVPVSTKAMLQPKGTLSVRVVSVKPAPQNYSSSASSTSSCGLLNSSGYSLSPLTPSFSSPSFSSSPELNVPVISSEQMSLLYPHVAQLGPFISPVFASMTTDKVLALDYHKFMASHGSEYEAFLSKKWKNAVFRHVHIMITNAHAIDQEFLETIPGGVGSFGYREFLGTHGLEYYNYLVEGARQVQSAKTSQEELSSTS